VPLAAFGQTPGASLGTGSSSGNSSTTAQSDVSDLPVCGQSAAFEKSSTTRSSSTPRRNRSDARGTKGGKRAVARRKRAAARRARARRAQAAARNRSISSRPDPIRATLTLDQEDQETVTAAAFGRSTAPQPLTLVYRVSGCRVTDDLDLPHTPLPTGPVKTTGARPLPLGSVQIDDVDADGDRYVVHLLVFVSSNKASEQGGSPEPATSATASPSDSPVSGTTDRDVADTSATPKTTTTPTSTPTSQRTSPPDEFSVAPGSYTSFVRLKAGWMRTVATPVTVTRSEDTEWIPIGIGVAGGLAGFALFMLARKIHGDQLLVREPFVLVFTGCACVVVGAGAAFFTNYLNQDIWTFNANGLALFTAAFSASTAGVTAGLVTGIYKEKAAESTSPPAADSGSPPAGGGGATTAP
jgi:hypothetical protein